MKILVIGSGGREHVLVWKIAQSNLVDKIYCAPGNAGIESIAECIDISVDDFDGLLKFARKEKIDLTVVGPEVPLVNGIVDQFEQNGLPVFGPSKAAAELEGSKAFAKLIMDKYDIPTGSYKTFSGYEDAVNYLETTACPVVIKADGLAAGKGAIVCQNYKEAEAAIKLIMKDRAFGDAGNRVVIEEFLEGEEASVLALTDGENYVCMAPAQDHKAVFDDDKGPNTGGMGAYAPAPIVDSKMMERVKKEIIEPTIKGMALEGRPYRGVLYAGLMITNDGPKVIEFNCRFGDPETQAILPLVNTDLVKAMLAISERKLKDLKWEESKKSAVCVIISSGGYPGSYQKGKKILGLDRDFGDDVFLFHAGTKKDDDAIVTNGGRVVGVTAVADTVQDAMEKAYKAVGKVTFDGAYYRKDIGARAIKRIKVKDRIRSRMMK